MPKQRRSADTLPTSLVHLIRHGAVHNPRNVVYGRLPGYGLSERGRKEAESVARWAARVGVSAIYSSPLERAVETAAAISRATGARVEIVEELTEWGLAEDWQGMTWDELASRQPEQLEAYLHNPEDLQFASESLEELATRMSTLIRSLSGQSTAVVSHADPLKAGLLALTDSRLSDLHSTRLPTGGGLRVRLTATGAEVVDSFEPGPVSDNSTFERELPPNPELPTLPMSIGWKVAVALAVVVAAGAAGSIGAAIIRITCEEACAVPYLAAITLGVMVGGIGTLILGVLVARSMMEWELRSSDREADVMPPETE